MMSYIRMLTVSACVYSWCDFSRLPWFNVYSEMGETLANLDTFYTTNLVLLITKGFIDTCTKVAARTVVS